MHAKLNIQTMEKVSENLKTDKELLNEIKELTEEIDNLYLNDDSTPYKLRRMIEDMLQKLVVLQNSEQPILYNYIYESLDYILRKEVVRVESAFKERSIKESTIKQNKCSDALEKAKWQIRHDLKDLLS